MGKAKAVKKQPAIKGDRIRDEWIERITELVAQVEAWCRDLGWSTRRISKQMEESDLGRFRAPALLIQEGIARIMLEPIARFAPGVDGVVDLYLMPAYDDIATLYLHRRDWRLHYANPRTAKNSDSRNAAGRAFTREVFREVVEGMKANAE